MNKTRSGVDCDGVILHYEEELFFKWCDKALGWEVDWDDFQRNHDWAKAMGGRGGDIITPKFEEFLQENEEIQELVAGARKGLRTIKECCQLFMVTARGTNLMQVTLRRLEIEQIGDIFDGLFFGNLLRKGHVTRENELRVLIEDSSVEIQETLNQDDQVTVIQFPACRGAAQKVFDDPRVIRLSACEQICDARSSDARMRAWESAWEEAAQILLDMPLAVS